MSGGSMLCGILLLCLSSLTGIYGTPDEYKLLDDLFKNYSNLIRPVKLPSQAIQVKVGVALQQIISMDEKNQVITVNLWMRLRWRDFTLTWKPEDYGNTTFFIVPIDQIWKPDIILYTNVDSSFGGMMETNAGIDNEGHVYWNAPAIFTSTCKIDVTYFPFDEQTCPLKFGSWAYDGFQVDLVNRSSAGDISAYIDNGEWSLVGMPVFRNQVYYACCAAPYPDVTFNVVIARRPLFYFLNLLIPCFLISLLTALDFFMPADAGEKVTLGITILLALIVFLQLVAGTLPPQSEVVPLIAQYFACTIVLVSMSSVMTVFVLCLHYRLPGTKPVPRCIKKLFLRDIAKTLGLGDLTKLIPNSEDDYDEGAEKSTVMQNNGHSKQKIYSLSDMVQENGESDQKEPIVSHAFDGKMDTIITELRDITGRYKSADKDEIIETEWKYLALVVDRIFLFVFMILTVSCTVGILMQKKPSTSPDDL